MPDKFVSVDINLHKLVNYVPRVNNVLADTGLNKADCIGILALTIANQFENPKDIETICNLIRNISETLHMKAFLKKSEH